MCMGIEDLGKWGRIVEKKRIGDLPMYKLPESALQ
jgi:hypothetical protein